MPERSTLQSGPSLEQILWRAMDRFWEEPALLDAEEFAEHIARAFDAEVPEEAFCGHFFAEADGLHRPPKSLAEAVARAAKRRLHVYEFDLSHLEYVIVEDKDEIVVVSATERPRASGPRPMPGYRAKALRRANRGPFFWRGQRPRPA